MPRDEMVELELLLIHQTDDAFKVALDEDSEPVWLPKALVKVLVNDGFVFEIECPVGLAFEKGLI